MTASPRTTESTAAPRAFQPSIRASRSSGTTSPRSRRSTGPPTATIVPSTAASTPRPVMERKSRAAGTGPRPRAAVTIARASGMLAVGLDRAGEREQLVVRQPGLARDRDVGDDVLAARQRARLVEEHGGDLAHPLERQTVLHQDAGTRRDRGGERDHQRDREAERVRARDHEHGDGVLDRLVGIAHEHPDDERDDPGAGRHVEQPTGGAVGECLRARARRLRFGDEPLDAGQRGVVADRLDAHPDRGVGRDRPGDDAVAHVLRDRPRLPGDHRLVELGFAVDDHAVGGHAGTRAHEHDVARVQAPRAGPTRRRRR